MGKLKAGIGIKVACRSSRYVINDKGKRAAGGNFLKMLEKSALGWFIVIRGNRKYPVDTLQFSMSYSVDNLTGVIASYTVNNRDTLIDSLENISQDGILLVLREGDRFTGGTHGDNIINPAVNDMVDHASKCIEIYA